MSEPYDRPPSQWDGVDAIPAGHDVYYRATDDPTDVASVLVWHWCTGVAPGEADVVEPARWAAAGVIKHTRLDGDAKHLHLEPSLLFVCCGMHGFIRNGQWESA